MKLGGGAMVHSMQIVGLNPPASLSVTCRSGCRWAGLSVVLSRPVTAGMDVEVLLNPLSLSLSLSLLQGFGPTEPVRPRTTCFCDIALHPITSTLPLPPSGAPP